MFRAAQLDLQRLDAFYLLTSSSKPTLLMNTCAQWLRGGHGAPKACNDLSKVLRIYTV